MFHSMMKDEFYNVRQPNIFEKISKAFGLNKFSRKSRMNKELVRCDKKKCPVDELTQVWKLHSLIKPHF